MTFKMKPYFVAAFLATILIVLFTGSLRIDAQDDESEDAKVRRGLEIAPVPLNLAGKNPSLVGLGSYIVNSQADCNGCHNAGPGGSRIAGLVNVSH
jgi:hypothetical protein